MVSIDWNTPRPSCLYLLYAYGSWLLGICNQLKTRVSKIPIQTIWMDCYCYPSCFDARLAYDSQSL